MARRSKQGANDKGKSELSEGLNKGTEVGQIGRLVQDSLTHRNTIFYTNAQIKVRCIGPRFCYCQHYGSLLNTKRDSVCQHSDFGRWITNFRLAAEIFLAALSGRGGGGGIC
jgi:hypothetical protein